MRTAPPLEQGFTLVELLFALVAGSLLLVMLGWAVNGLAHQLRREATVTAAEKVDAITPFLESVVGHAIPPAHGAVLAGTPDALALTVPPPRALVSVGPVRLLLSVVRTDDGAALVARFATDAPGQTLPPQATRSSVLASGFKAIRFDYLRRASDRADRLPRLITITFTAKDGVLLPIGLEPRLGMGADCVFDPISLACRP